MSGLATWNSRQSVVTYIKHSFYFPFSEVAVQGNAAAKRVKILTSVVTQFGGMFKDSKYLV